MTLIHVMTKDTREATIIQTDLIEDRKEKYDHLSGRTRKDIEDERNGVKPTPVIEEEKEDTTLQDAQLLYTVKTGKEVPARYKNDKERLLSKISD